MKKIIAIAALMAISQAVLAAGMSNTVSVSPTTSSTATTESRASNDGNSQSITFTSPGETHSTVDGTQTLKNVPSVNGPALTTSNDTCMGSTSGSVNIAGLGLGGGSTWTDTNCKRLKNSRELWNMGMKAAAMALMCKDDENREALEQTGYKCPAKETKDQSTPRYSYRRND